MARGMKKDGGGGGTWILMKKYEVGKLVGKGTFAKVYHARRLGAGESVAIKVIDKERVMRVGMIDQIKREISILHRVRHPNIVRLHEVMASKTKIYFVMEYVRGGELFGKVAKGRIKEDAARKYFRQLLGAVDFCHSKGVYHRDLKPENLLVDDDGQLKVSDFGLSAIMESRQQDGLLHTTCGTPAYIAPEVINNKGYDGAKADLWSLGVVLFVLTTGYLPFDDSSLPEMYRKIRKGEFKCPHWLSTDLKKLLHRLLDPNPGSRISMGDIMECPWFKTGLSQRAADARQIHNLEQNPTTADTASATFHLQLNGAGISADRLASVMSRPCLNAFDIISLSPAFNLSGLFMELDGGRKPEARFMTRKLVPAIVSKPGEIGAESREMGFQVRKKDGAVKLEGSKQGRKGTLAIDTEIFQVTPSFFVVEVTKAAGDTIEYQRFCSRELGPILFW